jgi:hypothetical protein
MKRRTVSEREDAEARETAAKHRGELLADLRAREVARRAPVPAADPAVPTDDAGAPAPDESGQADPAQEEPPGSAEG